MMRAHSTPVIAELLGVPYQTLHRWMGLISADARRDRWQPACWSHEDVVLAAVVRDLRHAGVREGGIRSAVHALRLRQDLERVRLILVGDRAHAVRTDRELASLLRGRTGVAVDVGSIARNLRQRVDAEV